MPLEVGQVQVYTGNGKGKTTAALGLAFRACGRGFKVCMIQFMKGGGPYGEHLAAESLAPNLTIIPTGREGWVNRDNPDPEDRRLALEVVAGIHEDHLAGRVLAEGGHIGRDLGHGGGGGLGGDEVVGEDRAVDVGGLHEGQGQGLVREGGSGVGTLAESQGERHEGEQCRRREPVDAHGVPP